MTSLVNFEFFVPSKLTSILVIKIFELFHIYSMPFIYLLDGGIVNLWQPTKQKQEFSANYCFCYFRGFPTTVVSLTLLSGKIPFCEYIRSPGILALFRNKPNFRRERVV